MGPFAKHRPQENNIPPLMSTQAPVMKPASSEARNAASAAVSSIVPSRRTGLAFATADAWRHMFAAGAIPAIALFVGLAMLPWFAGLLVVGPVIGHASWHAYRSAVA